jgi:hypothetical protein
MRLLIASATVFTLAFASAGFRAPDQLPQKFTNLKILPTDIAPRDLVSIMKQFCSDLNVRCEHCHVGEGNDLSKFDFASDARPTKASARVMLKMVSAINGEHLKTLPQPATQPVTCFTCHRGAAKPATRTGGG